MEKKQNKHYSIEELDVKNIINNDGEVIEKEANRIENTIKDLKNRVVNGGILLEREKEFLYIFLKTTDYEDLDFINRNPIFQDFIFRELYLTYFHNNLQFPFYKLRKGLIIEKVGCQEFNKDMKKIIKFSNEWLRIIQVSNHTDQVLKEVATETRANLKELDKEYPSLKRIFSKNIKAYKLKKDKIILQSKYIYMAVKRIMEDNLAEDFQIEFLGEKLEFTAYTFVHILSRHYAEGVKQMKDKTYHYQFFLPEELHIDLKNILQQIDRVGCIEQLDTKNIVFEYKGIVYSLWIEEKTKQVKTIGNVKFNRIQTFYPIYDGEEKNKIEREFTKIKIDDFIYLYKKN